MLKFINRRYLVFFSISVLLAIFSCKKIYPQSGELFLAFSEHSEAVRAGKWRQAADGVSDAFLSANMRMLFVDNELIIDRDSDKSAARIVGNFLGQISNICNHAESYELLRPDSGTLVVTAWVLRRENYRLMRGEFSYIRVNKKWQIDRVHVYLLLDAGKKIGRCIGPYDLPSKFK